MLRISQLFFVFCILALLASCNEAGWDPGDGSDNGGGGNNDGTREYFGPRDVWQLSLETDGKFALTRKDSIDDDSVVQLDIQGTYQTLATGYMQFTVGTFVAGVNSTFAGLEMGDDSVILMPVETASKQIIALVKSGTCPDAQVNGGWIKYKFADAADSSSTNERYFGTWRYNPNDPNGASFSIKEDYSLANLNDSLGGTTYDSEDCSGGLASGDNYSHYLSGKYTAINLDKDVTETNEFSFGFPTEAIATTNEFTGNYVGFMSQSQANTSFTVSADCTNGICQIYNVDSLTIVSNLEANKIYTMTLDQDPDQPEDGFITGTWENTNNQSSNIACAVVLNVNADQNNLLTCVAQFPAGTIVDAANLFLLSTD